MHTVCVCVLYKLIGGYRLGYHTVGVYANCVAAGTTVVKDNVLCLGLYAVNVSLRATETVKTPSRGVALSRVKGFLKVLTAV